MLYKIGSPLLSLIKKRVKYSLKKYRYHHYCRNNYVKRIIYDPLELAMILDKMEAITQYHIENPADPADDRRTLCFLGSDHYEHSNAFLDIRLSIEDAVNQKDEIPDIEKCELCWRDEDKLLLLLLGYIGEQ